MSTEDSEQGHRFGPLGRSPETSTYRITFEEARQLLRGDNTHARWNPSKKEPDDSTGLLAVERLKKDLFVPKVSPSFKFSRSEKIFALGSCFAVELEKRFWERGFRIESYATSYRRVLELLYTTPNILDSLEWALGEKPFPEEALIQVDENTWLDPFTARLQDYVSREETLEERRVMNSYFRRVRDCRVVVITLGLIEVWRDEQTGYFHPRIFPDWHKRTQSDRYSFHVLSYEENWRNLEAIHSLLSKHGHPDLRIVVTVSPVPLTATWTDRDVVVANTYSKSMLRTVAEAWAAAHDNVDYFPSYEIAVNSNPEYVWLEDGRHIQSRCADHIIRIFTQAYLERTSKRREEPADWPLATEAPIRVIAWPEYRSAEDLLVLFEQFAPELRAREDVCLCLRYDLAYDRPTHEPTRVIEEACTKTLGPDADLNILILDDPADESDWPALGRSVDYALMLPSAKDGIRASFLESVNVPVLRTGAGLCAELDLAGTTGRAHDPA
jgi:hypothetical protein